MDEPQRPGEESNLDAIRGIHEQLARGAGGTPGGTRLFFLGLVLAGAGLWFFLGNVHVVTRDAGVFSGAFNRGVFGGEMPTASTGVIFVPLFVGLVILFYDARLVWGWGLVYAGLAIIVIEILSRIHFLMQLKTSNLLLMFGMVAAGIGMMLRSYRDASPSR